MSHFQVQFSEQCPGVPPQLGCRPAVSHLPLLPSHSHSHSHTYYIQRAGLQSERLNQTVQFHHHESAHVIDGIRLAGFGVLDANPW